MLSPVEPRRYRSAGFTLDSDFAFSRLLADRTTDAEAAEIHFRIGELPPSGQGLTKRRRNFGFTALEGRRVIVSVSTRDEPETVARAVLTGGLNAVAYQRGLLPLHASAIEIGQNCLAFCGESGAGKSTVAAALAQAGYPLLCDDLVVVHVDRDGCPLVWPSIMRPKLTRHSMELLDGTVTALSPVAEWDMKAVTQVGQRASYGPRRLAAIYLFGSGEAAMCRLSRLEAATMLYRCLRNREWLERAGTAAAVRQRWLELVSRIPIILVMPPREHFALSALVQTLIDSWQRGGIAGQLCDPIST
jgi:hypothetical protein